MKNLILLTTCIVLSFAVYGQKCDYDFEKKDPFTGKTQKGNSSKLAGFGPSAFRIFFQAEDKKYLCGLNIVLGGRNDNYVESGDTLSIAMDNGEVLSLRATDRYLPNVQVAGANILSVYNPIYSITEDQLKKLTSFNIKATKVKIGSLPLVAEVPSKNADKVKKAAACILL